MGNFWHEMNSEYLLEYRMVVVGEVFILPPGVGSYIYNILFDLYVNMNNGDGVN